MNKKLYVARSPRIAARMLGEEMLVMSGRDSTLFTLNPTATILWQAADGATPLDEIVERRICSEFEVKPRRGAARCRGAGRRFGQARHPADLGATDFGRRPLVQQSRPSRRSAKMSVLLQEMSERALRLGVPFSVQLDLTYRCNEQCVHCYLDHDDHGEMTTVEIKHLLKEMAEAGVFILTLSGGEIFMRKDFFEILECARALTFCIKLKTNAVLIREAQAARLRELGVESIQISIYSHRPEVHDAITKVPGSLRRSINAIRFLKSQGLESDHRQCADDRKHAGLSRSAGAGRRTRR